LIFFTFTIPPASFRSNKTLHVVEILLAKFIRNHILFVRLKVIDVRVSIKNTQTSSIPIKKELLAKNYNEGIK
jgi:S-ribosylhomocysteine lyase LuxS involved in autoinducer biosynthesis